jgi:hypothetical protein
MASDIKQNNFFFGHHESKGNPEAIGEADGMAALNSR